MERWNNRVAIVTGVSSGIGKAIAIALLKSGMVVVGIARRENLLKKLSEEVESFPGKFYYKSFDIRNEKQITECIHWTVTTCGSVDVLINNAGIYDETEFVDESMEHGKMIMETNYLAGCIFMKEVINKMKLNGIDDGHIININSVAGHYRAEPIKALIHNASKHCVTLTTDSIRRMLVNEGSKIKITSLSPGVTIKESSEQQLKSHPEITYLETEDIVNATLYILGTPKNVQVCELTIRSVGEIMY
ncbi:farnesol dehydrogenase-like [Melanaphis sacchari]|uniref:Dehydrogenase/reductase SDR family member 11 n=1 Tax=Melanaphis sacchari TaxID=742174 RepID=A0A2H8TMD1_9HEMI|nr:farnesol dehydrogenase-like [Melanaphis sacchari]XP_025199420.1 farnesol dehydrogenase-like [Melanaphis sacchari]XP_025199421.1 farnesol dehydrogenase-like [Melanaphis sacchari]XP_025199422.1 farnesol dehydrogenase-like [Melanaphis sacchari]